MPSNRRLLQATAGSGEAPLYVDDVFSVDVWIGNGTSQDIVNGIDLSGEGGMVMIKAYSGTTIFTVFDTERGAANFLPASGSSAENSDSEMLSSFNSNGFSIGSSSTVNGSGATYLSITFRKAPGFFDLVSYQGNATGGRTVAHSLGVAPAVMWVKNRIDNTDWRCYHKDMAADPETDFLQLNQAVSPVDSDTAWNDTAPGSSSFTVGNSSHTNGSADDMIAYLFADGVADFGTGGSDTIMVCDTFTTDGSGQATVSLGWEPDFFWVKTIAFTEGWFVFDQARGIATGRNEGRLAFNSTSGQSVGDYVSVNPDGFQAVALTASQAYVYCAVRRPMKTISEAGFSASDVAIPLEYTGTTSTKVELSTGFPVDMAIFFKIISSAGDTWFGDRLRGNGTRLRTDVAGTEGQNTLFFGFDSPQITVGTDNEYNLGSQQFLAWFFRRVREFFEIVTYIGTGSAHTEAHNLGVAPELMIIKNRDVADAYAVYYGDETDYLSIDTDSATTDDDTVWNDTAPTSSVFTVGTSHQVNASGEDYIAYLFASVAGVCDIGTYAGTGSDVTVDCGFSSGTAILLIKRVDAGGSDWHCYDSEQGIVAGNDPYKLLSLAAAQATGTDYIDPDSSGFVVTSAAPAALNTSGGTYLYFAIAA